MIQLFLDKTGTGKTRKMIDMANNDVLNAKGDLVYIDISNKQMFNLHKKIRLISTKDFYFETPNSFYTFLCGIISQNYDIEKIYIDGIYKMLKEEDILVLFDSLEDMCAKYDITLIASLNNDNISLNSKLSKYTVNSDCALA